jgi:hypothetical protein
MGKMSDDTNTGALIEMGAVYAAARRAGNGYLRQFYPQVLHMAL